MKHGLDIVGGIDNGGTYYEAILKIIDTLPFPNIAFVLLIVTMIMFYATSFDTLTMIASTYSYKRISIDEEPDRRIRTLWAVMFILLPIGLIFAENTMYGLEAVRYSKEPIIPLQSFSQMDFPSHIFLMKWKDA